MRRTVSTSRSYSRRVHDHEFFKCSASVNHAVLTKPLYTRTRMVQSFRGSLQLLEAESWEALWQIR